MDGHQKYVEVLIRFEFKLNLLILCLFEKGKSKCIWSLASRLCFKRELNEISHWGNDQQIKNYKNLSLCKMVTQKNMNLFLVIVSNSLKKSASYANSYYFSD